MRVIAVVHMAEKAVAAPEPRAGSDKYPAIEPVGAIVAIGSAIVGGVVEIPIRAIRRRSEVDAYGHLRRRTGGAAQESNRENRENNHLDLGHNFSLSGLERERSQRVVSRA
jgi:hypothetical protein